MRRILAFLLLAAFGVAHADKPSTHDPLQGVLAEVIYADSQGQVVHATAVAQLPTVAECGETLLNAALEHESEIEKSVQSGLSLYLECFDLSKGTVALIITPKDIGKDESGDKRLTPEQSAQPRHGA